MIGRGGKRRGKRERKTLPCSRRLLIPLDMQYSLVAASHVDVFPIKSVTKRQEERRGWKVIEEMMRGYD